MGLLCPHGAARAAYLRQTSRRKKQALVWDESFTAAPKTLIVSLQQNKWPTLGYRRRWGATWRSAGIFIKRLAAAQLDDHYYADFQKMGIRFPNVLQFRQLHAQALQATGRQRLALQATGWLAKREPFNPQWWQAKAATLQQLEDSAQSRQQLAIAHALAPQDLATTEQYLIALIMAEHADQAVDVARNWMNSQSTQTPPHFTLLAAQAAYRLRIMA